MRTLIQILAYFVGGVFALVVILGLLALGRTLRTGLDESEWTDDELL